MSADFRAALTAALEHSLDYLATLDRLPVAPTADPALLRARLTKELGDEGLPPEQVVADLIRDSEGGILRSAGGRFFAWVVGGHLPAALAADWLTSAWDQNAGIHASGPAAAIVEEVTGAWLKDVLGLPAPSSFAFVTGCQMAHTTCLAAARHALLAQRDWNVETRGLSGAPPIRLLTSAARHGSLERSVRLLGMGLDAIVNLPTNPLCQVEPDTLEQALAAAPGTPTIVVLLAGDVNTGAFDSFESLIPIAHRHHAWVHVDGAFGLWAAASPRFRDLTRGMELADSWATDGHKFLNVPYDSGFAFVAGPAPHRASMSHREPYLQHDRQARDQMDWNPEWSRRARAFSSYAALRQLGRNGIAQLVERCCDHARALTQGIGTLNGAEIVWPGVLNQGLVRFLDPTGHDHDRRTDRIIDAIVASGEAYFGGTTWQGRRAMRISVCNWQTTEDDVRRTIAAARQALAQHSAAAR